MAHVLQSFFKEPQLVPSYTYSLLYPGPLILFICIYWKDPNEIRFYRVYKITDNTTIITINNDLSYQH